MSSILRWCCIRQISKSLYWLVKYSLCPLLFFRECAGLQKELAVLLNENSNQDKQE